MSKTFIFRNTTANLSVANQLFGYSLLDDTATAGTFTVNLGNQATLHGYAWTDTGVPGTDGATGSYSVEVYVNTANTDITMYTRLARVNSSGTVQTESDAATTQSTSAGLHTFNFTDLNLGTWASGDRLRVQYTFINASHGNQSCQIQSNTTDTEVATPYTISAQGVEINAPSSSTESQSYSPAIRTGASILVGALLTATSLLTPQINTGVAIGVPSSETESVAYEPTIGEPAEITIYTDGESALSETGNVVIYTSDGGVEISVPVGETETEGYEPAVSTGSSVGVPISETETESYTPGISTGVALDIPPDETESESYTPGISTGVALSPPLSETESESHIPGISTGVALGVPLEETESESYVPQILTGVSLGVPLSETESEGYTPEVLTGVSVSVPISETESQGYIPGVDTGVSIDVPTGETEGLSYTPEIITGTGIEVPSSETETESYIPSILTGASLGVPLSETETAGYEPAIASGSAVQAPLSESETQSFSPNISAGTPTEITIYTDAESPLAETGNVIIYTTDAVAPIDVPLAQTESENYTPEIDIEYWQATFVGEIQSDGGATITERGFVYGRTSYGDPGNTAPDLTNYEKYISEEGEFAEGEFSLTADDLIANATYYYRAYGKNIDGYSYGDELSLITSDMIRVPVSLTAAGAYSPSVSTGVSVGVPLGTTESESSIPDINTGSSVSVPLGNTEAGSYTPEINTGVSIGIPTSETESLSYSPSVDVGVSIGVPVSSTETDVYSPTVTTGGAVSVGVSETTATAYPPAIETGRDYKNILKLERRND
jgi:hypothetical protein